jgi:hypothetical protein
MGSTFDCSSYRCLIDVAWLSAVVKLATLLAADLREYNKNTSISEFDNKRKRNGGEKSKRKQLNWRPECRPKDSLLLSSKTALNLIMIMKSDQEIVDSSEKHQRCSSIDLPAFLSGVRLMLSSYVE